MLLLHVITSLLKHYPPFPALLKMLILFALNEIKMVQVYNFAAYLRIVTEAQH